MRGFSASVLIAAGLASGQVDVSRSGPRVGAAAPAFSLADQNGRVQTLASVAGPKGTMLVFFRSVQRNLAAAQAAPPKQAPKPAKQPRKVEGRQLSVISSQSDLAAAPGTRLSLMVDVLPKPGMHVYAPEQTGGYIRIELDLDEDAAFKTAKPVFPKASDYRFEPLNETFKVFEAPFRIRQDITLALTPALRRRAAAKDTLAVTGTLRYQACDDQVCYRPDEIKVAWTVALQPLVPR